MNARFFKFADLLCLVSLFAFSQPFANAEPTTNAEPRIDIQIQRGQLWLEPLKSAGIDVQQIWGSPGELPEDRATVTATINNLAKYLRAIDPTMNIVVSDQAAPLQVNNLKLHAADMREVVEATEIATDQTVRGGPSSGRNNWYFVASLQKNPTQTVEVFNIGGYLGTLGKIVETDTVHKRLDDIEMLIRDTVASLHPSDPRPPPLPDFKFHEGTGLLIVIGPPEAIEVTRKIIDALPGQQAAQLEQAQQLFDELDKVAAKKQK